jgi:hypothetical protein
MGNDFEGIGREDAMAKLNWKSSYEGKRIQHEARASHEAGGRYRIWNYSQGWVVNYCPPKRRWWPQIGKAPNEVEAAALAQAHNDRARDALASQSS